MFDQTAEQPASDQSAPMGMRELPPQPARPVMPAYTLPSAAPASAGPRADEPSASGTDDSVIAADDHVEGTFTSRGTVVVMGSLKGRIEAVRLRIENGASVDAEVIVDEAIVAGEFTGNLTCRERLEARPTGRISGRVETFKLMLHEGASVEGEMHMLTERPRDASETIRGTAPLRGDATDPKGSAPAASLSASAAAKTPSPTVSEASSGSSATAASSASASTSVAAATTRPAPVVAPSSAAKASRTAPSPASPSASATPATTAAPTSLNSVEAILAQRSPAAQTMRIDSLRVAPRSTTSAPRSTTGASRSSGTTSTNGTRGRNGTTTAF